MIRIILKAKKAHPSVVPSCFVDDLSVEMTGPDYHVLIQLVGFVRHVARSFVEAEMELSKTKSVYTASTEPIGKVALRWAGSWSSQKYKGDGGKDPKLSSKGTQVSYARTVGIRHKHVAKDGRHASDDVRPWNYWSI